MEGGFRVPAVVRSPGKINAGAVENGIFSELVRSPRWWRQPQPGRRGAAAEGTNDQRQDLRDHLDGYNQIDLLLGKGPSARHRILLRRAGTSARCASERP